MLVLLVWPQERMPQYLRSLKARPIVAVKKVHSCLFWLKLKIEI